MAFHIMITGIMHSHGTVVIVEESRTLWSMRSSMRWAAVTCANIWIQSSPVIYNPAITDAKIEYHDRL